MAATDSNNLALGPNFFAKCTPSISTNIKQCGTVTACSAKSMTASEFANYTRGGDYLIMGALMRHDMEIKMCDTVQNGLYDFLMANKVNINKKVSSESLTSGLYRIKPFILAKQYSAINNAYWAVTNGQSTAGGNWQVGVASTTNIPLDIRSFPAGIRVYIRGLTAGQTVTQTAWQIVSSALAGNGTTITLVLSPQNSGSYLTAGHLASPVTGVLQRGTPNVDDFEQFCAEMPAYLNWKYVPFWLETQRTTMCNSSTYDRWRKWLMADNELYRNFGDLDEIDRNKQLGMDWQKRMVETMLWGKPINTYQTTSLYNNLPQITSYDGSAFGLGVEGAQCVGLRANMVGVYEQLAECGRVVDLQGGQLNMTALFNELYNMKRVREGNGGPKTMQFDLMTDSITAVQINTAMITYANNWSQGLLRLNMDVDKTNHPQYNQDQNIQEAEFGFNYRSYNIQYPAVRINIITHYFFDDYLTANAAANQTNAGRLLLVLDWSGIYPGIAKTNRKVWETGDLQKLAAINTSFACVMEVNTQRQTLTSVTGTMIVECPQGSLWLENFSSAVPSVLTTNVPVYPPPQTYLGTYYSVYSYD